MLSYQFDCVLSIPYTIDAQNAPAEHSVAMTANHLLETFLEGSALWHHIQEQDRADLGWKILDQHDQMVSLVFIYPCVLSGSASSLSVAEEQMQNLIEHMLEGSDLAPYGSIQYGLVLEVDDDQPGLDEFDTPDPFAIAADASMYHIECAKEQYGAEAVERAIRLSERYSESYIIGTRELYRRYPKDDNGNLLHVVTGHEHVEELRQTLSHGEDVYASCQCGNTLYDPPREEGEDA